MKEKVMVLFKSFHSPLFQIPYGGSASVTHKHEQTKDNLGSTFGSGIPGLVNYSIIFWNSE